MVISVPLTTLAVSRSSQESSGYFNATLRDWALSTRADLRAQTRALTRLNARCEDATEQTKDLTCRAYLIVQKECLARQSIRQQTGCPTMGEVPRVTEVQKALEAGEAIPAAESTTQDAQHAAAGQGPTMEDISSSEQRVLRRLIQLKTCSENLPRTMYLLCTEMVGEDERQPAPTGLLNDLAKVQADRHMKTVNTLNDRIDMTIDARKR